ncbi:hypothetical protein [Spirosoma agri]|nr:hypothetical protein [Spirosoma agri]
MNQARARYYVLYLHDGNYLYHAAEDKLDAQQVLAYYTTRTDILVLGTYDPHNWYFDWAIGEDDQHAHLIHVNTITDKLRQQHERWLR